MESMSEVARVGHVKVAVLGRPPEFLQVAEWATLEEILQLSRIPQGMDVRVNGGLVPAGAYAETQVELGSLVVAVPRIEGGGSS